MIILLDHYNKVVCLPPVSEASASSPVELENAVGVGHGGAVQSQSLGSRSGGGEVDETVSSVAPTTNIRIAFKEDHAIGVLTQRTCHGSS